MEYTTESNLDESQSDSSAKDCGSPALAQSSELRGLSTSGRESLLGAVRRRLNESTREAQKMRNLRELARLLDKNPDVARILDLIEEVKY